MKPLKPNTWKSHLDELIIAETSLEWIPFPKQYLNINIDKPIVTRQISTKNPSVHVVAKITEDFAAEVNAQDEESLPPRVFCWNDVSTLSLKVAFKTVSAGLESQYRKIINNVTFDIKSFSSTNRSSFTDNQPDYLVYHIINPSLSESPISAKSSKIKYSFSNNQLSKLKMKKSAIFNPMSFPETIDASSLQQLGESITGPSIFIFDCPNAVRMLENIIGPNGTFSDTSMAININKEIFAFGATNGILPCSSQLPYDLFTSCLLTPAKIALLMQTKTYADFNCGVLSPIDIQEMINILNNSPIADKITDSLEKALEQFADRIAFESLEMNNIPLFELVFRRDSFIANLFYHYLFACRVMKRISTTPFCFPYLPDMTNHPLWDTFDLEVDRCLFSLKKNIEIFSIDILLGEQMKLLEDWIAYPIENREMPDELSYLALLLDSPKYFERAIHFTAQFLSISAATTEKFLNTRAFPVLLHKIPYLYSYILGFIKKSNNVKSEQSSDAINDNDNSNESNNNNNNNENNNNNNENNNNNNNDANNDTEKGTNANNDNTENNNDNDNTNNNNTDDNVNNIIPKEKEETLADFSFSIASSILLSPDLRPSFDNYLTFWEKLLTISSSERLIISCLACLIQFDMNQNNSNLDLIKRLSKHKSSQVRTLAHFLLKKMKVPLELPMCKISDEEDPFCRVALVSRISESITQDNKHDLIFDLILSLSDLFSFVREEAVTTLAQAIEFARKDTNYLKKIDLDMNEIDANSSSSLNIKINEENLILDFFGSLKMFFTDFCEDNIQNPIILSLAREIAFLTYDPSNRVRKRFSEFLFYLESILFPDPKPATDSKNSKQDANQINIKNIPAPTNTTNNTGSSNNNNDTNRSSNSDTNTNNNNNNDNNIDNQSKSNDINNNDTDNNDDAASNTPDLLNINDISDINKSDAKNKSASTSIEKSQPRSNLFAHILSAIVHYTPEASDDCYGVSHAELSGNLTGTPAVSPSGLIACPCADCGILCQSHNGGTFYYNFFNQSILLPQRFHGLVGPKKSPNPLNVPTNQVRLRRRKCLPTYLEFIDDEKLLSVSDSSQVIIIDLKNRGLNNGASNTLYNASKSATSMVTSHRNQYLYRYRYSDQRTNSYVNDFLFSDDYMKSEPSCSFWMEHPDNCYSVKVDYNNQNFHLLEHQVKPESCKVAIFDLASQRRIEELLISKNQTTIYSSQASLMNNDKILPNTTPQENWCISWLHSFSPLFCICTNEFTIYDERIGEAIQKADLNLNDDFVIGCNSPIAMPLNVVVAKRQGSLAMVDFRTMKVVDEVGSDVFRSHNKVISSFKVHKEIPFGFGTLTDNSSFTVMFDSGNLAVSCREQSTPIHSFALHATEATCIARYGSSAKFLEVKLEQ